MSEIIGMLFRVAAALAHCARILVRVGFFKSNERSGGGLFLADSEVWERCNVGALSVVFAKHFTCFLSLGV